MFRSNNLLASKRFSADSTRSHSQAENATWKTSQRPGVPCWRVSCRLFGDKEKVVSRDNTTVRFLSRFGFL